MGGPLPPPTRLPLLVLSALARVVDDVMRFVGSFEERSSCRSISQLENSVIGGGGLRSLLMPQFNLLALALMVVVAVAIDEDAVAAGAAAVPPASLGSHYGTRNYIHGIGGGPAASRRFCYPDYARNGE